MLTLQKEVQPTLKKAIHDENEAKKLYAVFFHSAFLLVFQLGFYCSGSKLPVRRLTRSTEEKAAANSSRAR